jgi:hypothetical protein
MTAGVGDGCGDACGVAVGAGVDVGSAVAVGAGVEVALVAGIDAGAGVGVGVTFLGDCDLLPAGGADGFAATTRLGLGSAAIANAAINTKATATVSIRDTSSSIWF